MQDHNELSTDMCSSNRREFLEQMARMLGGVAVGAVLVPVVGGCEPSFPQPTAPSDGGGSGTGNDNEVAFDAALLASVGSVAATTTKGTDGFSIMLTRLAEAEYAALSMRCTHQSCSVRDDAATGGPIVCPCHGSKFDLDGAVLQGPAGQPLKRYPTRYDAATDRVIVTIQ